MNSTNKFFGLNLLLLAVFATQYNTAIDQQNSVLILIQQQINLTEIQNKFIEFQEIFELDFGKIWIDFQIGYGIITLFQQLENSSYSTILYVMNEKDTKISGYCDMSDKLSEVFNKSIIFWPCPKMKQNEKLLPAYETISYAVKSIAQEFNWTEAVIFATETNWGLSLAIAANLHVPYQIEIGTESFKEFNVHDKFGKVLIICSSLNSPETQQIIKRFVNLNQTKILLIDIIGSIFNSDNQFYKFINNIDVIASKSTSSSTSSSASSSTTASSSLTNSSEQFSSSSPPPITTTTTTKDKSFKIKLNKYHNLLVLTILTEKFKQFMNTTLHIELIKHYHNRHDDRILRKKRSSSAKSSFSSMNQFNDDFISSLILKLHNSTVNSTQSPSVVDEATKINFGPGDTNQTIHRTSDLLIETSKSHINSKLINNNNNKILSSDNKFLSNKLKNLSKDCDLEIFIERNFNETTVQNLNHINDLNFDNIDFMLSSSSSSSSAMSSAAEEGDGMNGNCTNLCEQLNKRILDELSEKFQNYLTRAKLVEFFRKICAHDHEKRLISGDPWETDDIQLPSSKSVYSEFFILYDYISTIFNVTNETSFKYDFVLLDFQSILTKDNDTVYVWRPFLILQQNEIDRNLFITHRMLPGYNDWFSGTRENFFTCGPICWGVAAIIVFILLFVIFASIVGGVTVRNYLLKKRLSKGPNKIVLSPSDFVFPVDSRRVDEGIEAMLCCWLQQLQEFGGPEVEKPDLIKGSVGSLKNLGLPPAKNSSGSGSLAKHNTTVDTKARYNGDFVQLKEIPIGTLAELKSKSMDFLVMIHGLRHENINPFIGWLSDPTRTAMVFEYCSRGSLQDVLIMDEIKLDWSFRLSLLTDLVRGMRYLHSSPIRVHGALTSRNCVVDARWVLKITDYGLPGFLDSLGLSTPTKTAKELLWTAPEALRNLKNYPKCGTQPSDVYSFGIIMQEVVVRGEPYCMLSLSAEEIITKIKKPPPLIRPSVSKGAAPPEAINIMRQCWAEAPEMRPDFNTVYERFKTLNHGRKVNFVDTMFQMLEKYSNNLEELIRERTEQLDIERKKTEQLLNRMLPSSVAEKLKMGLGVDPEEFAEVTIYFSDIVGFTTIAAHCSPVQVVDLLNDLYTCFDATINAYSVYKVETIGDAYMVVSGLPVRIPDHAEQIATMALDLLHQSGRFRIKHLPGVPLQLRIGLHTGPCCAGVVGLTMPRYCLFGDTVNTASRMESTGSSWRIHLSERTRDRLEKAGGYHLDPRGPIEIKGKGLMNTYWLLGKKGFDKLLPTPPPIGESHGLDESLIRNSLLMRTQANKLLSNQNQSTTAPYTSTAQSPSGGESFDIKVEITPPGIPESISNSFSIDSIPNTNLNILPDYQTKSTSISPQQRKLSELPAEGLLNPANLCRLAPGQGGSVNRLFKRLEDMMDLSFPYNHYRCLSPSENNLSQCADSKMQVCIGKFDATSKPGSTRFLRRQFSLDKEDGLNQINAKQNFENNSCIINEIIMNNQIVKPQINRALHKQNSSSLAQDLEKIEELPCSPSSNTDSISPNNILNNPIEIAIINEKLDKEMNLIVPEHTVITMQTQNVQPSSSTSVTSSLSSSAVHGNNSEIKLNVESLLMR